MFKRKSTTLEIDGIQYIIKEPTGSQLHEIFGAQEEDKRIESAFLCLKYAIHTESGERVFQDDLSVAEMMAGDVSSSIATTVTAVAMGLVSPKKV